MPSDDVPDATGHPQDGRRGTDEAGRTGPQADDAPTVPVEPAGRADGNTVPGADGDTVPGADGGGIGGSGSSGGTAEYGGAGTAGTDTAGTTAGAGGGGIGGTGGAGDGPGWSPPPRQPWQGRRMRRSRRDRMVTGVAGGIGEHLGIDPTVARVAFVVLAVFGGSGVLLYLLCWFFMPEEGEEQAPVDGLLGRGRRQGGAVREAALVAACGLLLAALLVRRHADDFLLVAAVLVMAFLLFRHLDGRDGAEPPGTLPPGTPPPGTSPPPQDARPGEQGQARFAAHAAAISAPAAPATHPPRWPARERTRQRSPLGAVSFCAVLVLAGVLVALDRASAVTVSPRAALALVLALVGGALVVGAWWGRARGLVALGLPVALVLVLAGDTLLGRWDGNDATWSPSAVASVRDEYRAGAGRAVLDLRSVDFTGSDVHTSVRMGAGLLRVELPPDVDVVVRSEVTAGSVDGFGRHVDGVNRQADLVDDGRDGPGGGRLEIRTTMDFGAVQVVR